MSSAKLCLFRIGINVLNPIRAELHCPNASEATPNNMGKWITYIYYEP